MRRDRIYLYDNMRAILILSVVIGHYIDNYTADSDAFRGLFLFICSFHMPAFIFLSGLFQKDRWELSRVLGFVFIGFALKITTSLVSLLLGWRVSLSLLQDPSVPWFMFALAGYITMSHVLRGVDKRFLLIFSVLLGCFVGYDDSIGDWMYLSRLVVFYPFFILGQMCEREKLTAFSRRPAFRLGGLAVLALWGAVCMLAPDTVYPLRRLFTGRNPFGAQFYPWGFAWRALCYGITLLVVLRFCARRQRGGCR